MKLMGPQSAGPAEQNAVQFAIKKSTVLEEQSLFLGKKISIFDDA